MAAPSYIPARDSDFDSWLNNFHTLIAASPTTYGLVTADATTITAQYTAWHAAYLLTVDPTTRTSPNIANKDAARAQAEFTVRPYAVGISRNPNVTNLDKVAVGVNLPNTARTPVPPPTTLPTLAIVSLVPNLAVISYRDQTTPTSKAKPPGIIGCQLATYSGGSEAPTPGTGTIGNVLTKSPAAIDTTGIASGTLVAMWGRWVTRSGPGGQAQFGPWGAKLSFAAP